MKHALKFLFVFVFLTNFLFAANPLTMKIMTGAELNQLCGETNTTFDYGNSGLNRKYFREHFDVGHYLDGDDDWQAIYVVFLDKKGQIYGLDGEWGDMDLFEFKYSKTTASLGVNTLSVSVSGEEDCAYINEKRLAITYDKEGWSGDDFYGLILSQNGKNYCDDWCIPISTNYVDKPSSFTVKVEAKVNGYSYSGTYTNTVYPRKTYKNSTATFEYIETSKGIVITDISSFTNASKEEWSKRYVTLPSKIDGKDVVEIDAFDLLLRSILDYDNSLFINVDNDNKLFCKVGNSLYSKDKKTLYLALPDQDNDGEFHVLPGTTDIYYTAFWFVDRDSQNGWGDIRNICFPDTVKNTSFAIRDFYDYFYYSFVFDGPPPAGPSWVESICRIYGYASAGWDDENGWWQKCDFHYRDESERVVGINMYAYDENWDETGTFLGGNTYYFEPWYIMGDGDEAYDEAPSSWNWSFTSGAEYASIEKSDEYGYGILTTIPTETTRTVVLKLQSALYPAFTKTMTLSVQPDSVQTVEIRGNDAVGAGYTSAFEAYGKLLSGKEEKLGKVTWSIVDGSANATVSATGVVTAKNVNATVYFTLQAEYTSGKTKLVGQKRISIEPSVKELTVNLGGSVVRAGYASQLSATAHYNDGSTSAVTTNAKWSLAKDYPGVTLTESGEIKVANNIEVGSNILLICEYSDRGVTKTTTATISVSPSIALDGELFMYSYTLKKGWNLIGIVLDLTPLSEEMLLAHTLYEFNSPEGNEGCFRQVTDIVPGKAYWLHWDDPSEPLVITGYPFGNIAKKAGGVARLSVNGVEDYGVVGEKVTFTAPEKDDFVFTDWTVNGVTIADKTAQTISFTMPNNEVVLTPNYASTRLFTLTVDGSTSQKGYGETVTVTAPAKFGYSFKNWTVSGVTIADKTALTLSFTMPANAVTLTPNYEKSTSSGKTYMVVTLSTGNVRYTDTAPDLSSDTCRTTELWLRRIPKGTFTMGSPEDELGRDSDETQHQVTLTKDYYIGVFEMTQRQYELITGERPSYFNNATYYATRPVEQVSYNMIRGSSAGAGWPANNNVDSESFLGKLRNKTSLTFDLPTEAQWEYACRAGTTTSLNTGKNVVNPTSSDANLNEAGRNWYNGGSGSSQTCDTSAGTAKVGSYLSNAWGLYDMHGNVWEWCLDWYGTYSGDAVDPAGAQSGSIRVDRGGCWNYSFPRYCRSAYRNFSYPSYDNYYFGFRVVCLP